MSLNTEKLKFFADYIEKNIGIVYTDTNYYQLEHRLGEIATQLALKNSDELYQKALKDGIYGQFSDLLLDLATNNETSFYRDVGVFEAFKSHVVPAIFTANNQVNMWCAASSTGQEPYSIAMILSELAEDNPIYNNYSFLISDYSERVLNATKNGIYSQLEVQRGLNARQLLKYFDQYEDNKWKIKDSLKKNMTFQRNNLLESWSIFNKLDVIFCRNVLIYQDVENKKKVVAKMHDLLKPNGFLILGSAESLLGVSDNFELVQFERAVFYKKKS